MTDTPEDGNNNDSQSDTNAPKGERPQMSISSDEVNYLVFRYLQECGYIHSAFSFAHESMLGSTGLRSADKTMPPGALVTFLQKGLQYVGIEERLRVEEAAKESAEKGKESTKKGSASTSDLSEFSLLSQAAMSAISRRDPPLQLNVPPATAAAAVKAKLQAEAKMEAERKLASIATVATESMQQSNLGTLAALSDASVSRQQPPPQLPSNESGAPAPNTGTTGAPQTSVSISEHLSNTAALARQQQALAAQALQLQQQQQQYAAAEQLVAAEQLAAAAGGGAPLASLANAFTPRAAADLLALQQGAAPKLSTDPSTLADAVALASQSQQHPETGTAQSALPNSQPQPEKKSKQQTQASSSSAKQRREAGGGTGERGSGSTNGPKRGTKRQKINNEEAQRLSETIAGLTAAQQQQQQGVSEMEKQNKDNNISNRGNAMVPHIPSAPTSMEIERAMQQKEQQKQLDFRNSSQQQPKHVMVHQQEFRPIHQAGQEQYLNGQILLNNGSGWGNGKLVHPTAENRNVPGHNNGGLNGERPDNNGSNNKNLVVSRMESNESVATMSNPEDLDTDTPQDHILKLEMHESEVFMCAWNPVYTNLIATGSGDASARIWQVGGTKAAAGLTTVKLLPHGSDPRDRKNKDVTTLEWSSDGTLLATGSYDGVARVWARNGALIHTLRGHTGPIFSLKWNKQGNYLLSGSYDKTTIVWDVSGSTGFVEQQFTEHKAPALDVDWKDNVTFASCSTDRSVHICRVGVSRPLKVYVGHSDEVNAVKWDPSGQLLASCSDDCTAKIWDVESDRTDPLYDLKSHEQEIYTVKWSPTGPGSKHPNKKRILATASFDGSVRLWSVADGSCYRVFNRHKDSVYSVAFSPSGDFLASGSLAGQMYVWDIEKAKHIKSYKGKGDIFEVAWNKEETRVAACFSSNVVAIIDFERPPS